MRANDIRYLVGEGLRNTWRNRFMSLASVGVLIICLLLTGFSYLFYVNIDHLFQTAYEQNVVAVYLNEGLDETATAQVGERLQALDNVAKVSFISKEESLERYSQELPAEIYESYQGENNPLPDTYIVSLHDLENFQTSLTAIEQVEGVESVSYDGNIAATLSRVRRIVLAVSGALIVVLLAVSLFIIVNTIKLTVYSRRLEIYIMKSVGATDSFVRLPFVVEGVMMGLLAGGIGYGLIYLLYRWLAQRLTFGVLMSLVSFRAVWAPLLIGFLVGGVLVGVCGSAISMNKYLKQEGSMRI